VPFCCRIVQIAKATRREELISFVKDDMISHVIRGLTLESSLNSTILTDLCRDAYKCVQNQVIHQNNLSFYLRFRYLLF
jgi:hypothetical protein